LVRNGGGWLAEAAAAASAAAAACDARRVDMRGCVREKPLSLSAVALRVRAALDSGPGAPFPDRCRSALTGAERPQCRSRDWMRGRAGEVRATRAECSRQGDGATSTPNARVGRVGLSAEELKEGVRVVCACVVSEACVSV
jgi:hypothetical protein